MTAPPSAKALELRRQLARETVTDAPLQAQRQAWEAAARAQPLAAGTRAFEDVVAGVSCLWVKPGPAAHPECILYAHGGGWVSGSAWTHAEFASRLAMASGRTVLLVDYRLLPEHLFPAPLQDVLAVYAGLVGHGRVHPSRLVLGGDSSGASLMLAALQAIRDAGDALPRCAFAISGAFDASLSGDTMQDGQVDDPLLGPEVLRAWQRRYLGGMPDLCAPPLSPLFGALQALPPMLLQVGEDEVWRSDSTRLAERLHAAGGEVALRVWPGMWHCWPLQAELPEAAAAVKEIADFLDARLTG